MNSSISNDINHPQIPASVLEKLVSQLLIHSDRDSLTLGLIGLIEELFQPATTKLYICGSRGFVTHRDETLNDLLIRDSLDARSLFFKLSDEGLVLQAVEEGASFTVNTCSANKVDLYVPLMQGNIVCSVLVLSQMDEVISDNFIWQQLITAYNHLNRMLYNAEVDRLTGLMNRTAFERLLNLQSGDDTQLMSEGENRYFALVDIDFFKRVNDNFGHLYGDEVLILLARAMSESFRSMDWLFRYGGEEFAIVLIGLNHSEALVALERFRHEIEMMTIPQVGQVTISVGFSKMMMFEPVSSVVARADNALYYAKNHGRNQVLSYEDLCGHGLLAEPEENESDVELF